MNFPCYETGQRISVGTSSAAIALEGSTPRILSARDILLYNPGPGVVHVRAGGESVVADNECAPVPAYSMWVYGKGPHTHLAAIAPDGAQELLVLVGEGA